MNRIDTGCACIYVLFHPEDMSEKYFLLSIINTKEKRAFYGNYNILFISSRLLTV
jgi:hypothetical protein